MTGPDERRGAGDSSALGPVRTWVVAHPADIVDLFVYVVVLNVAI